MTIVKTEDWAEKHEKIWSIIIYFISLKNNSVDSDNDEYIRLKIKIQIDQNKSRWWFAYMKTFLKRLKFYDAVVFIKSIFKDNYIFYSQIF